MSLRNHVSSSAHLLESQLFFSLVSSRKANDQKILNTKGFSSPSNIKGKAAKQEDGCSGLIQGNLVVKKISVA